MTGTDLGNECEPRRTRPATVKLCWLEFRASQEFGLRRKQIKGHLISTGERRPEATRPWPTFRPRPLGGQGQKAMTGRHATRHAKHGPREKVHSVGGARWRRVEYSYRLGGVWGKSPMVRPLITTGHADPKITWAKSEQWSQPPEIMTKVQRSAGAHNLSKYHLQQQSLAALEAPPKLSTTRTRNDWQRAMG